MRIELLNEDERMKWKHQTHQFLEGGGKRYQGADPVLGDNLESAARRLQPQLRQTLIANSSLIAIDNMIVSFLNKALIERLN